MPIYVLSPFPSQWQYVLCFSDFCYHTVVNQMLSSKDNLQSWDHESSLLSLNHLSLGVVFHSLPAWVSIPVFKEKLFLCLWFSLTTPFLSD